MKNETIQIDQNDIKKPERDFLLIFSGALFLIVSTISAFLFFENMNLGHSIEINKNEIAGYISSIEKIKSNDMIIKAELVKSNRDAIRSIIKTHEVQTYIAEVRDIATKYKMMFSGFSYANGKINTSALSIPEKVLAGEDGIRKISDFIRDYRTGSGLLFELSPVLSISGYEQKRAFAINFTVTQNTTPNVPR